MIADLVGTLIALRRSDRGPGRAAAEDRDAAPLILHLFGGPFVSLGERRVAVPEGGKRLLVFVALHLRRVERRHAAGALWPSGDDVRAAGNLRSALWRLKRAGLPLIEADEHGLALRPDVVVDVELVNEWAMRLIRGTARQEDLCVVPCGLEALDLLPGWYDDWVLLERERVRQRLLHALEILSRLLVAGGRGAEAVEAAMTAVTAEPLRETAQAALIEAHLAEGNVVEARRSYRVYCEVMWRELGVIPRTALADLVRGAGRPPVPPSLSPGPPRPEARRMPVPAPNR